VSTPTTSGNAETFAHGSDVGIRGTGNSPAQAFERVAQALTSVVVDLARVRPSSAVELELSAPDLELLLLDWVDALIYEMSTRRMLFSRFEVEIEANALRARVLGEALELARHQPAVEVKGATAAELRVVHRDDGTWLAQCVVDV